VIKERVQFQLKRQEGLNNSRIKLTPALQVCLFETIAGFIFIVYFIDPYGARGWIPYTAMQIFIMIMTILDFVTTYVLALTFMSVVDRIRRVDFKIKCKRISIHVLTVFTILLNVITSLDTIFQLSLPGASFINIIRLLSSLLFLVIIGVIFLYYKRKTIKALEGSKNVNTSHRRASLMVRQAAISGIFMILHAVALIWLTLVFLAGGDPQLSLLVFWWTATMTGLTQVMSFPKPVKEAEVLANGSGGESQVEIEVEVVTENSARSSYNSTRKSDGGSIAPQTGPLAP
jgi:uncharacterized membrane protein